MEDTRDMARIVNYHAEVGRWSTLQKRYIKGEELTSREFLKYQFGANARFLRSLLDGRTRTVSSDSFGISEDIYFLPQALDLLDSDIDLTTHAHPSILHYHENGVATFSKQVSTLGRKFVEGLKAGTLHDVDSYTIEQLARTYEAAEQVVDKEICFGLPV